MRHVDQRGEPVLAGCEESTIPTRVERGGLVSQLALELSSCGQRAICGFSIQQPGRASINEVVEIFNRDQSRPQTEWIQLPIHEHDRVRVA